MRSDLSPPAKRRTWLHMAATLVMVLVSSCGRTDSSTRSVVSSSPATPVNSAEIEGTVVVFAASSLTEAFAALGEAFMAAHPDVEISYTFAASSEVATQIAAGAPADVVATADSITMDRLVAAGLTRSAPEIFAGNRAAIIVTRGNPHDIGSLEDLRDPELIVLSCALEVPCGRYAQQVLDRANVSIEFDSYEENSRSVVSKVSLGEADAGIVYRTDVAISKTTEGIEIPDDVSVIAKYPVAITIDASNPDAAEVYVAFLLSPAGRAILESFGFLSP